jgi:NAD(P)-dependent dehydrogenase (short-subunit alcohol dehydrogenase family)
MTDAAARGGRLEGKVAVVTGAAQGIGAASARALAANGAAVAVGDIDADGAEGVAAEIREQGGQAVAVTVDAGNEDSVAALMATTVAAFGGLDVVHNNALAPRRPENITSARPQNWVHESDEGWFTALLHGTVVATMLGAKHAVPHLRARGGGSIINTASVSGLVGEVFTPAYGAGKAGVVQLTRAIAAMYGRDGIRCNAICPGLVLSPTGNSSFDERLKQAWQRQTPMNRLGRPEDVAHLAVYLAADESEYMTGQALVIDGGFTMHDPIWPERLEAELAIAAGAARSAS